MNILITLIIGAVAGCNKATTYKQIIKQWSAAGFVLVDEEILEGSYLMKFKPSF